MRKFLGTVLILAVVSGCSGGETEGGGGSAGATLHDGFWTLVARITAIVGGAVNALEHTTKIKIEKTGNVAILSTDSTCGLTIFVNGNMLHYEEKCVFPGAAEDGGDNVACTLTMRTVAQIVTPQAGSGTFGPETLVCTGTAASYSGTLVATRDQREAEPEP